MAIGGYRISTESYRPAHVGSGRATVGMPHGSGVADTFGNGIKAIVNAGNNWYQHVIMVGQIISGSARKMDKEAADAQAEQDKIAAANAKRQNQGEMLDAIRSY